MGLFDIFKKKACCICGNEVGLLGNRKLEDGNMCSKCAKKLSPWFEDRKKSTVAQIKEQLAYREENRAALEEFRVSQVIGDRYKIYIEEAAGIPSRFFVTNEDPYLEANPDIISFKDVLSCSADIQTHETELKQQDSKGNQVSYNPPRYKTDYNFYIDMHIDNNPYFDDIRFKLNSSTVTLETRGSTLGNLLNINFTGSYINLGGRKEQERYQQYMEMCQQIEQVVQRSKQTQQAAPVSPAAPAGPKFCPNCGAPTDGGKFCQSCGSRL